MLGLVRGAAGLETATRWQTLHTLGRMAALSQSFKGGWRKPGEGKERLPPADATFTHRVKGSLEAAVNLEE